jgi:taurine dioxygenase
VAPSLSSLNDALAVEVTGVDLSSPVSGDVVDTLTTALRDNLVMVVRNQKLGAGQYLDAVRLFGETMEQHLSDLLMEAHPEIAVLDSRHSPVGDDGRGIPLGSKDWHTDHTNHSKPPKMTAMYAIALPRAGGDTGFANMHLAYETLSVDEKAELDGLKTVNKIEDNAYVSDEHKRKFGAAQIHPLVRTHPETGRKAIYIHPGKTARIEGMDEDESNAFVDRLMARAIQPEITYRHQWQRGDLVIWDNRAVSHIAYRDYDHKEGRVMQRVILAGDTPY